MKSETISTMAAKTTLNKEMLFTLNTLNGSAKAKSMPALMAININKVSRNSFLTTSKTEVAALDSVIFFLLALPINSCKAPIGQR